jgi:hypothetical protein
MHALRCSALAVHCCISLAKARRLSLWFDQPRVYSSLYLVNVEILLIILRAYAINALVK